MAGETEVSLRDELGSQIDAALTEGSGSSGAASSGTGSEGTGTSTTGTGAAGTGSQGLSGTGAATETQTGKQRAANGQFTKQESSSAASAEEGKPAAAQGAEQQQPDAAQQTTGQQQGQQVGQVPDLPPSTWGAAAKAEYAKLPEVVRKEVKKREADMVRGIQQYKTAADFGSRVQELVRPYEGLIRASGSDAEGAIREVLRTNALLRTGTPQEKGQLLMRAAQEFGADLSPWLGGQQQQGQQGQDGQPQGYSVQQVQQVVQQLLQPHLQRIDQFATQYQTAEQRRQQESTQQLVSHVEAFRTATDSGGRPKHIYFENVRKLMGTFIESGEATSMDTAYEMACRAHPEVSQLVAAEQRQAADAKQLEEARRKATEAQRAGAANVSGQGGIGIADSSKTSLRDELAAQLG